MMLEVVSSTDTDDNSIMVRRQERRGVKEDKKTVFLLKSRVYIK